MYEAYNQLCHSKADCSGDRTAGQEKAAHRRDKGACGAAKLGKAHCPVSKMLFAASTETTFAISMTKSMPVEPALRARPLTFAHTF